MTLAFPLGLRVPPHAFFVAYAIVLGAALGIAPGLGLAMAAATLVTAMAFATPTAHLLLLLFVTGLVPHQVQNAFSLGGEGVPGLVLTDLLLLTGLVRATWVLGRMRLDRRVTATCMALLLLVVVGAAQLLHGHQEGHGLNVMGVEGRAILGFTTAVIAMPVLLDAAQRARLLRWLVALGLVLGAWGIVQWVGGFEEGATGDFGVREGVRLTSGGKGQVQGGLYLFPVAVTLAFAVLVSGHVRTGLGRLLLVGVIALNIVSAILTYERTFWVATVAACALAALRAGHLQRMRAVVWSAVIVLGLFGALAVAAPAELVTARERFVSLGQYATDDSVRTRLEETRAVLEAVRENPVTGNGLGASVRWGQPWDDVPKSSETYSHLGYLWVAWKLGIPAAVLLTGLFLLALAWRGPPPAASMAGAVRNGAQAGIFLLLLASITFPPFNDISVTPLMGLLLAVCAIRWR